VTVSDAAESGTSPVIRRPAVRPVVLPYSCARPGRRLWWFRDWRPRDSARDVAVRSVALT